MEDFQLEASMARVLLSGAVTSSRGARKMVSGKDATYHRPEKTETRTTTLFVAYFILLLNDAVHSVDPFLPAEARLREPLD